MDGDNKPSSSSPSSSPPSSPSPPPFTRTVSGLPLCGECHRPAGQCEHTAGGNGLGERTVSMESFFAYSTDSIHDIDEGALTQHAAPSLKRQCTADILLPPRKRARTDDASKWFVFCDGCNDVNEAVIKYICMNCRHGFVPKRKPCDWKECATMLLRGVCAKNCNDDPAYGLSIPHCRKCDCIAIPLPQMTLNTGESECIGCYCVEDKIVAFECEHSECLECFHNFATSRIRERKLCYDGSSYTIACPFACKGSYIDSQMFRMLGNEWYGKYKRFAALNYAQDHNLKWCTHCARGFIPRVVVVGDNDSSLTCHACNREYKEDDDVAMMTDDEKASMAFINECTKPCPNCSVRVFKSGGCNHMRCSQCEHEFCWIHLIKWGDECRRTHWTDNPITTQALVMRQQLTQRAQSWCVIS